MQLSLLFIVDKTEICVDIALSGKLIRIKVLVRDFVFNRIPTTSIMIEPLITNYM